MEQKIEREGLRPVVTGFGFEFPQGGIGVDWALAKGEVMGHMLRDKQPVHLDMGGASGRNAEAFARMGYRCVVLDLGDEADAIAHRNKELECLGSGAGRIELCLADVREIDPIQLGHMCGGVAPSVVTAFNLFHFLNKGEVERLVDVVASSAEKHSVLAISYDTGGSAGTRRGLDIDHDPDDIVSIVERKGYALVHEEFMRVGPFKGRSIGKIAQGFRLEP